MSRVGGDDLRWWLDLAPTLSWTFARTYADSAPHWYVVRGKAISAEDILRVARVIRAFGEPGKFHRSTNLYLYTEDRRLKFWAMWDSPPVEENIGLINLATTDRVYGAQENFDMPRLRSLITRPVEEG